MKSKIIVKDHVRPEVGKGVFAAVDIQGEEIVIESHPVKRINQRNKYSLELNGHHVVINEPGVLVNHSCQPNCILLENNNGGFNFIASRKIFKDEEITFDYQTIESAIIAFKDCYCGSANCRRVMKFE